MNSHGGQENSAEDVNNFGLETLVYRSWIAESGFELTQNDTKWRYDVICLPMSILCCEIVRMCPIPAIFNNRDQ